MTNTTNLTCRQILETKEVLENQIISDLISEETIKSLSIEEKKELSLKVKSRITSQFNSLVDRIQKILS